MDEMTGGPNQLTTLERDLLKLHEMEVERCEAEGFRRAWALREIRGGKLYRETHDSWDAYCRDRWDLIGKSADREIRGANVADDLRTRGFAEPRTEKQARYLSPLTTKQRIVVALRVKAEGGFKRVSARRVKEIAEEVAPRTSNKVEPAEPAYRGMVLVRTSDGKARLTSPGRSGIKRGIEEMASGATRVLRTGPYAIYDYVREMPADEVDALRDVVADVVTAAGAIASAIAKYHGDRPAGQQRLAA